MGELERTKTYACALPMPHSTAPDAKEWIEEIARQIDILEDDKLYLIGHSLGATAVLRYLESGLSRKVEGIILVSGPYWNKGIGMLGSFLDKTFDIKKIKDTCANIVFIHGDNDETVPVEHSQIMSKKLGGKLIIVPNGRHLSGADGWRTLPQCLDELRSMMEKIGATRL